MLIGQFTSKLTDKDRISVPKKFRAELGEEMIVARWYERCLVLVSKDGWRQLLNRLSGATGPIVSPVRDIDRFVLGMAFEINLDKQGRFIVPDVLMTYADIKNEVVFVGLGDRVELWAQEKWKELEKVAGEKAEKAIEKMARQNEKNQKATKAS
jgi:MraZ protein